MIHWHLILSLTHFAKFSFSSMLGWAFSHTSDDDTSLIWYELSETHTSYYYQYLHFRSLSIYLYLTFADCANCSSLSLKGSIPEIRRCKEGQQKCSSKKSVPQLVLWHQWLLLISHLSKCGVRSSFNISLSLYLIWAS